MKLKIALFAVAVSSICFAQAPPSYPPGELDRLVQRVALYPDPLLAQVLSASTFADQIPDAAAWADRHHYLTGDTLARAISEDPASVGSQRSGTAAISIGDREDGRRYRLDDTAGKCCPGTTFGCDGCRTKGARSGDEVWLSPAECAGHCSAHRTFHFDHAGQPGLRLRALLRSGDSVCCAPSWICDRRCNQFRIRIQHWRSIPAVGLGCDADRLGLPRLVCA